MGTQTKTNKRIMPGLIALVFFGLTVFGMGCQQKAPRIYKVAYSQSWGGLDSPNNRGGWDIRDNPAAPVAELEAMKAFRPINTMNLPPRSSGYHIGPGDVVELKIYQLLDLSQEEVLVQEVDRRGLIYVPLLNYVPVAGMTSVQLRAELIKRLGQEFIKDPQVEVQIQRFGSKQVMVLGAVARPGMVALEADSASLLEVISKAGGISNEAAPDIEILRGAYQPERNGGAPSAWASWSGNGNQNLNSRELVPISLLFNQTGHQINPVIYPGDVVKVPTGSEGYIYVAGEVKQPGAKSYRRPLTILQAITCAGGLNFAAEEKECQIIRRTPNGGEKVITVDLEKIRSGEQVNLLMAQNDTVMIKANGWKKFLEGLDQLFQRTVRVGADVTYDAGGEMGIPRPYGIR